MTDHRTIAGLGLSLDLLASPAALAQEEVEGLLPVPDYGGDLWNRSHLTGDWGGTRTDLANKGIQVDVDWTQYVQGVADGGIDRKTRYGGHVDYLFHLDLMRMGLIPGGLVTLRAESRYGESVNGISGQIPPVNTTALFPLTNRLDEDVAIAITDLNYTQFLSEHLAVLVGKLDTLDADLNEFACGRGKSQFMNENSSSIPRSHCACLTARWEPRRCGCRRSLARFGEQLVTAWCSKDLQLCCRDRSLQIGSGDQDSSSNPTTRDCKNLVGPARRTPLVCLHTAG
jgi:hypothetical protein